MRSEEAAACSYLERFLRKRVDSGAHCRRGDDPPDLICEAAGRRYGVEVTFANAQETFDGKTKARMERDIPLLQFGERLGIATQDVRSRDCHVLLHGPPKGIKPRQWERSLELGVRAFLQLGKDHSLELEGASIRRSALAAPGTWLSG